MTPPMKCTGIPSPAWMDTVESINAAAEIYREKLPALMERTGAAVIGTQIAGVNVCVEDRSTWVVFHWFECPQKIGSVAKVSTLCSSNGQPQHQWDVHMRILRQADISEVREMAKQWGGPTPLKIREGLWYQVLTD